LRAIKVFILKLWVDEQAPEDLRGSLQAIPDGKTVSFGDGPDLISSLQRFARVGKDEHPLPIERGKVVNDNNIHLDSTWERKTGRRK